jgi:hypothetical protein
VEPGTLKGPQLVVPDLRAARAELAERGVDVSDVQVIDGGPRRPAGSDDQLDYRGFVFFADPDGNSWAIQQLSQPLAEERSRLPPPISPAARRPTRLMGSAALASHCHTISAAVHGPWSLHVADAERVRRARHEHADLTVRRPSGGVGGAPRARRTARRTPAPAP